MGTTPQIATGYVNGTGAAVNVSIGFIPDVVIVSNLTDGDRIDVAQLGQVIVFTSAGTATIQAGQTLVGATSGATCKIKQVILDTGSYAAGDGAGWLIVEDVVGTIATENMYIQGSGGSNDISVVVNVSFDQAITTAVAPLTSNHVIAYAGSTTAAPGFTIGSTVSEDAKLLHYIAIRN